MRREEKLTVLLRSDSFCSSPLFQPLSRGKSGACLRPASSSIHEKNDFAEVSENLDRYRSENNFVGHQNNYVECLSGNDNVAKNFDIFNQSKHPI